MPIYKAIVDDLTDFPWLGVSLKPGETVETDHPEAANHPLLKKVTKAEAKSPKEKE